MYDAAIKIIQFLNFGTTPALKKNCVSITDVFHPNHKGNFQKKKKKKKEIFRASINKHHKRKKSINTDIQNTFFQIKLKINNKIRDK